MRKLLSSFLLSFSLAVAAIASPVKSNLGGDGEKYGEVEPYTASSYVQDGLFLMYDGIENVGWGEHDSFATEQVDLGPYNLSFALNMAAGYRFEDDCLFVPKNYYTPRTIDLTEDAYSALITALSNATLTVEYVWEDLGSSYQSGDGQGTQGPLSLLNTARPIIGCRIDSFRGDFWSSGYGYYWGPTIRGQGVQNLGSYGAVLDGLVNEYKTWGKIRWNDTYAEGPSPDNSSTLHGTWATRVSSVYTKKQLYLFANNYNVTGRLFSLRIYTRALTIEEMAHNWNVDRERFGL